MDFGTAVICLLRILLSLVIGFFIGYERKIRSKEAGIRTHSIVCVGSCLYMIISIFAFGSKADTARVAAQIVSGIGFLGAGMIFYHKQMLRGLTTAAGIWATAAIGMACGAGLYVVAIGSSGILIIFQLIMHTKAKFLRSKHFLTINVIYKVLDGTESDKIKKIFCVSSFSKILAKNVDGIITYNVIINTDHLITYSEILRVLKENPYILSIEREDNEY